MRHFFFIAHQNYVQMGPPINILMQTWDDLDDGEMGGHPMGMIVRWVVIQWV
jgi:hypothetical protein